MILLILMFFCSVNCCASQQDKNKISIEKSVMHKNMIKLIYDNYEFVKDASIQNLKIHQRINRDYEISTVILSNATCGSRKQTVSYYKKYQDCGAFCMDPNSLKIEIPELEQNAKPISKSESYSSLVEQVMQSPLPQQKVRKPKRRSRANSMADDRNTVPTFLEFIRVVIDDKD